MSRKNAFKETNYVNVIGQLIEPGDEVLVVTRRGYNKRIHTYKGRYDGMYVDKDGNEVSASVFGVNRRCYRKTGETQEFTQKRFNYKTKEYEYTKITYPKYEAYNRITSSALPNKMIFKIQPESITSVS
jgi:hypothetical protein